MTEKLPRSYLRDGHGPRAVDNQDNKSRNSSNRRHRTKKDSHPHRKPSVSSSASPPIQPRFELDIIGQPAPGIILGTPIDMTVMISVRPASSCNGSSGGSSGSSGSSIDTTRLIAAVTLVGNTMCAGDNGGMPLEPGILTGQQMFDSVHAVPEECMDALASSDPCRLTLGYFSFPSLLIRQPGTFALRTTLIGTMGLAGGSSVLAVDSELIKVERCNPGTQRKRGSGCG